MRIGIDGTCLTPRHIGGKDQVLLNLLRGFEEIGTAEDILLACHESMEHLFGALAPSARLLPVPCGEKKLPTLLRFARRNWIRSFRVPRALLDAGAEFILFPSCNTSLRRLPVPSAVIPHDLQPMIRRSEHSLRARCSKGTYLAADFRLRDYVVAISDYDRGTMEAFFPRFTRKIVRLYNPVALSPEPVVLRREPTILAVNIQYVHKNTETLIRAFEKISDFFSHRLILAGSPGGYGASLMEYVKGFPGLAGRVEFTGFLPEAELDRLYRTCALYVNPSLFEGFGMTAVEAVIKGAPVLLADVAANREVTAGLCGYYAPADDADALASAMAGILRSPYDPEEAERKGRILHGRYNASAIAREYWAFFERALGKL